MKSNPIIRLICARSCDSFRPSTDGGDFTMMRNQLAIPALALALATSGFAMAQPFAASPAAAIQDHDRDHDRGWDVPPQEFRDIQRQGYHDGIEGARKDYDNHRRPDVNNRDEYRHPHVPDSAKADYREGFRRGYEAGMDHLMNGGRGDNKTDSSKNTRSARPGIFLPSSLLNPDPAFLIVPSTTALRPQIRYPDINHRGVPDTWQN